MRQMSELIQLKLQLHPLPTLCQVSPFKCNLQSFKQELFPYVFKPILYKYFPQFSVIFSECGWNLILTLSSFCYVLV